MNEQELNRLLPLNHPKFKLSAANQELIADYLPYCLSIAIPNPPPATPECRDGFDLPFLQLAIAGQADVLVSGDQDLLSLAGQFACPILRAAHFLQSLNS